MSSYVIPLFISVIIFAGLVKKVKVFEEFTDGAYESLKSTIGILPSLIAMITAVEMFKASGALEIIINLLTPITELLGFPIECLPLVIMRPISGSGTLAVYDSMLETVPVDSLAERVASVIMGATDTSFYTIALYYSVTKIKNTRHTLVSSLSADFTGFIISLLTVLLLF